MMKSSSKSNFKNVNFNRSRHLLARAVRSCTPLRKSRVEILESRVLLSSYTLTSINFGMNGAGTNPVGVAMDALGNQYGTTSNGGVRNSGTIFMIAKGSSEIETLASCEITNGSGPRSGVTLDAAGDLFGTTPDGGAIDWGVVFELPKGAHVIQALDSFTVGNGSTPSSGVALDLSGNLFGTARWGGAHGGGTVFEIPKGTNTIQTLASFDGSNGSEPFAGVTLDSAGNLYGTTLYGGAHSDGTVFEIRKGTNTIQTIASFDGSNGAAPFAGITLDATGNLYGTTFNGGASNAGTVFEVLKGTSTIKTLACFNSANGSHPWATVTLDSGGNLYGTTYDGGAYGHGTVFRIAKGTGTIETLFSFDQNNGSGPIGGVTVDSAGNLYGTTYRGGVADGGTAYKLSPNAPKPPTNVVVNSLQDVLFPAGSGTVSLRNAVAIANANTAPTTITFDSKVFATQRTISMSGTQFELSNANEPTTILGPGANLLTLDANAKSRIFMVDKGVTADISGLTITHGNVHQPVIINWDATAGGGVMNDGTLNLSNAVVTANHAGSASGGGVYNRATANLLNVTLSNNEVDAANIGYGGNGGGFVADGPVSNLTNCTISGNNTAEAGYGGGVVVFGGNGLLNLVNDTIVNNAGSFGGGLSVTWAGAGTTTVANTIIANNNELGGYSPAQKDVRQDLPGLISKGHNLIGVADASSAAWIATDHTGTLANPLDPKLSALGKNGGPMPTIVPLAGSPAIDAGGNALIPTGVTTDQRGLPRISGAAVDIGATEVQSLPVVTGFVLVNADTNKDVMPITEGMTLDLATLPRRLNIRAIASSNAKSVQVVFDGKSRMEFQASWSAFGDWNGDFIFGNLATGSHTLSAQAFTGKAGTGTAGPITTLHFKIINKAPAPTSAVTAIVLFNTVTGKDIRVLHNYDTLDLSLLPATLGIRVQTTGTVGSVQYVVDGKMNAPATNALIVGQHHLTAIPYSGASATGTPGGSLEIHLFVIKFVVAPALWPA